MNFTDLDPALRPLLDRYLSPDDRARIEPVLVELGEAAAGELDEWAAKAEAHPPTLRAWSPRGERVDEVEFHPAYEQLAEAGFCRFGLAALSHRGTLGWSGPAPHLVKYALSYLYSQAEFGLGCPINMTDSAARVLEMFDAEAFAPEIAALTSTDPGAFATGAMFMTEVDGGTDLGRTATVATDHGDHWTLSGRKWFCSNVTADVILTLAQVPGQGEGTRGLGMFLVPRRRPDGSRNSYRVDRLKDKLGTRSMASGEVTLDAALARPVGDLTRGIQQMLEMVNHSRVSNVMRSAALMRRALHEAVTHARERVVFDRPLFDQPLMRRTLLGLQLDVEAALGLVLEIGDQLEKGDEGDEDARTVARVLTPMAKYSVCKRGRWVTAEAMEVRGGNGYIEDWVNPRLVRDAHLGSIWEGASNVVALDVLRCMRLHRAHDVLARAYLDRLPADGGDGLVEALAGRWRDLLARGDELLARDREEQELAIGDYTEALAQAVMATLLVEQAAWEEKSGHGRRKGLVATAALQRLLTPDAVPAEAVRHLAAIVDGGEPEPGAAK